MPTSFEVRTRAIPAFLLAGLLLLSPAVGAGGERESARYSDVSRVYAIGDVHGAFAELMKALKAIPLVDEQGHWSGGDAYLVMLGDLVDRGDDSRKVLDLLMRLQTEARKAGGRVHVVMGNHEVMNLVGDLRYVSTGEFASYQDMENAEERKRAAKAFRRVHRDERRLSRRAAKKLFEAKHPPGFFGHRRAMSLQAPYGKWLAELPLMIIIDRTVFAHAGVLPIMAEASIDDVNERFRNEVLEYLRLRENLIEARLLEHWTSKGDSHRLVRARLLEQRPQKPFSKKQLTRMAHRFFEMSTAMPFDGEGPVWYRGNAKNIGREREVLSTTLRRLGVDRVVVGHTPTPGHVVVERFSGMVLMMDTGMLRDVYDGQSSVLEIKGDEINVIYPETGVRAKPSSEAEARARSDRASQRPDEALENRLRTASVILSEDVGRNVSKAEKPLFARRE